MAVIDNGLNKSLYYKLTGKKIKSYCIRQGECLIDEDELEHYDANHGTVCTALLSEFTEEAEVISISVNESGKLPLDNMGVALLWCINHNIDIICMSIGTSSWLGLRELYPIFELLEESKIIVVGAGANDDRITFPASLPSVLGVRYKKASTVLGKTEIAMINNPIDGIDIETDMPPSRVLNKLEKLYHYEYPMANSMVAPYITAKIIRLMNQGYECTTMVKLKRNLGKYICTLIKEEKEEAAELSSEECISFLENLAQPVIGILYQDEKGNKGTIEQLILGLQQLFYKNGFKVTILSTVLASNIKESIFCIENSGLEESFLSYTRIVTSDLFLLHLPISALISHNRRSFMDFIIEYMQENTLREIVKGENENWMILPVDSKSVEVQIELIYNKIVELYG